MHDIQRTKDVEGYTLGNVCTNKQLAIDAKDRATLSEIAKFDGQGNIAPAQVCTLNLTNANASSKRDTSRLSTYLRSFV